MGFESLRPSQSPVDAPSSYVVATCRVRIRSLVCAATRRDSQKFTVKFRLCKGLARHRKSSNPRQFFRPTWRLGLKADDDHGGLLEACQSTPLLYVKQPGAKATTTRARRFAGGFGSPRNTTRFVCSGVSRSSVAGSRRSVARPWQDLDLVSVRVGDSTAADRTP